jgi:hypothetical protein
MIEAILTQEDNGKEFSVAYLSRRLLETEGEVYIHRKTLLILISFIHQVASFFVKKILYHSFPI